MIRIFYLSDLGHLKSVISTALEEIPSDFSTGTDENMSSNDNTLPVYSGFTSTKNITSV